MWAIDQEKLDGGPDTWPAPQAQVTAPTPPHIVGAVAQAVQKAADAQRVAAFCEMLKNADNASSVSKLIEQFGENLREESTTTG